MDHNSLNIFWHNEKVHEILNNKFGVYSSNYDNINYLLALAYSDFTSPIRYHSSNSATNTVVTSNVPYPRIHHSTYFMAPMREPEDVIFEHHDVSELIQETFDDSNKFVKTFNDESVPDQELFKKSIYNLSSNYIFRGDFVQSELFDVNKNSQYYTQSFLN